MSEKEEREERVDKTERERLREKEWEKIKSKRFIEYILVFLREIPQRSSFI